MAQLITFLVSEDASYSPGQPEQREPVSVETLAAMRKAKRKPRNLVLLAEPKDGIAGHLIRKARPRKVQWNGSGIVQTSTTGNARPVSRVTMPAADAARYVGLTPEETATFLARFPSDGTAPAAPADPAAVAKVFRKVNAWRGTLNITPSADVETLA